MMMEPAREGAPTPKLHLLFADTLQRPDDPSRVNEIIFRSNVIVKEVQIVHVGETPHKQTPGFVGHTRPPTFDLQFFTLDITSKSSRFQQLTDKMSYGQVSSTCIQALKQIETNHLVVRGNYELLSMCIYGDIAQNKPPEETKPDTVRSEEKDESKDTDTNEEPELETFPIIIRKTPPRTSGPFDLFPPSISQRILFEPCRYESYEMLDFSTNKCTADDSQAGIYEEDKESFSGSVQALCSLEESKWPGELLGHLQRVHETCASMSTTERIEKSCESCLDASWRARLVSTLLRILDQQLTVASMKMTFSLLGYLVQAESWSSVFVSEGGFTLCYGILRDDNICSLLKESCLGTLSCCLMHSCAQEWFSSAQEGSKESGYQIVLSTLVQDRLPPARVVFAAKQVLNLAEIYACVKNLRVQTEQFVKVSQVNSTDAERQVLRVRTALRKVYQMLDRESQVRTYQRVRKSEAFCSIHVLVINL